MFRYKSFHEYEPIHFDYDNMKTQNPISMNDLPFEDITDSNYPKENQFAIIRYVDPFNGNVVYDTYPMTNASWGWNVLLKMRAQVLLIEK